MIPYVKTKILKPCEEVPWEQNPAILVTHMGTKSALTYWALRNIIQQYYIAV